MVRYMVLLTFGSAEQLHDNLNVVQFTFGLISPSGCFLRTLLLTLNQSQLLCRTRSVVDYPGDITVYGGPYLYFLLQCLALFVFLVCYDLGWRPQVPRLRQSKAIGNDIEKDQSDLIPDVTQQQSRIEAGDDELRLLHLRKEFCDKTVVEDVTLGVDKGRVLSLLGPNGAGKTTTMGLIRGDLRASSGRSEVLVSGHSVRTSRFDARRHLGVCPQFNATDRMNVTEHLAFYGRLRGVKEVSKSVASVIQSTGLGQYSKRLVSQLSGGNQRKLSLATATIGNPSVLLLDEPSSGMDALAMRTMWQAIRDVSAQRAVLITTHSMEEASQLSDKVVIINKRILSVGSPMEIRKRHGKGVYQVQIALKPSHDIIREEVQAICDWVVNRCDGQEVPERPAPALHRQARFQVAFQRVVESTRGPKDDQRSLADRVGSSTYLVSLLTSLEESKARYGVGYYSVSPITLEAYSSM